MLSPDGCAAWPAAPESLPNELSAPARPGELSATAYCEPEPGPGSPDTPEYKTHTQSSYMKTEVCRHLFCWKKRRTLKKNFIHIIHTSHATYVDHGIRRDAEQRGPLSHLPDFIARLSTQLNALQLRQGPERNHVNFVPIALQNKRIHV